MDTRNEHVPKQAALESIETSLYSRYPAHALAFSQRHGTKQHVFGEMITPCVRHVHVFPPLEATGLACSRRVTARRWRQARGRQLETRASPGSPTDGVAACAPFSSLRKVNSVVECQDRRPLRSKQSDDGNLHTVRYLWGKREQSRRSASKVVRMRAAGFCIRDTPVAFMH